MITSLGTLSLIRTPCGGWLFRQKNPTVPRSTMGILGYEISFQKRKFFSFNPLRVLLVRW